MASRHAVGRASIQSDGAFAVRSSTTSPTRKSAEPDHLRNIGEAAIVSAPGASWLAGAGAELLATYLPSALEKRRECWFNLLNERLADVERRVLADEAFQTTVLQATKAALGTHFDEKLELLAQAVRSSADTVATGGDGFMDKRLLQWVDELDPLHFQILGAIYDHREWGGNVPWADVLSRVQIAEDDVWYEAVDDLTSRRLAGASGYNPNVPLSEMATELIWVERRGVQLVTFVRMMTDEPEPDG